MKLRNIDFGHVFNQSGARGFFGEVSSYQWPSDPKPNWEGATFVAKTTTLHKRVGNLPVKEDGITPLEQRPKCIVVNKETDVVLNSVGLTGPGVGPLLGFNRWQKRTEPFSLSFMAIEVTPQQRLQELRSFVGMLKEALPNFNTKIGLEINFSCPNTEHKMDELLEEVDQALEVASQLDIPLVPKFNALLPIKRAIEISNNSNCDAILLTNTIPWGSIENKIAWPELFGSEVSPLSNLGGGGLSGKPLLNIVTNWIIQARLTGLTKPIIGGGGILSIEDAGQMFAAGATAITLGTVSILHPERVEGIIALANSRKDI